MNKEATKTTPSFNKSGDGKTTPNATLSKVAMDYMFKPRLTSEDRQISKLLSAYGY